MGNDILDCILRLVHTNLLISLLKYITQVTEKCIHNAGVGGSTPPVATTSPKSFSLLIRSLVRIFDCAELVGFGLFRLGHRSGAKCAYHSEKPMS